MKALTNSEKSNLFSGLSMCCRGTGANLYEWMIEGVVFIIVLPPFLCVSCDASYPPVWAAMVRVLYVDSQAHIP